MEGKRRHTIVQEIERWREARLLPEAHALFLLRLYGAEPRKRRSFLKRLIDVRTIARRKAFAVYVAVFLSGFLLGGLFGLLLSALFGFRNGVPGSGGTAGFERLGQAVRMFVLNPWPYAALVVGSAAYSFRAQARPSGHVSAAIFALSILGLAWTLVPYGWLGERALFLIALGVWLVFSWIWRKRYHWLIAALAVVLAIYWRFR